MKSSIANIVSATWEQFRTCPLFLEKFKLQYEHQIFKEFVDLDHPHNLQDKNSNRLLVVDVEDDGNEADKSASISSDVSDDDSENSMYV